MAGGLAGSVQYGGDGLVRHLPREGTDKIDHIRIRGPSRLAWPVPLRGQAAVVATLPVDNELKVIVDDVHDDLRDNRADDLLTGLQRRS